MDNEKKETAVEASAKGSKNVDKKAAKKEKTPFKERAAKFLRENKAELKKISWYSKEQTFRSSLIVIVSIVVVSAFVSGLDFAFSNLLMWLGSLV